MVFVWVATDFNLFEKKRIKPPALKKEVLNLYFW
jgi:hypothetical protein